MGRDEPIVEGSTIRLASQNPSSLSEKRRAHRRRIDDSSCFARPLHLTLSDRDESFFQSPKAKGKRRVFHPTFHHRLSPSVMRRDVSSLWLGQRETGQRDRALSEMVTTLLQGFHPREWKTKGGFFCWSRFAHSLLPLAKREVNKLKTLHAGSTGRKGWETEGRTYS